MRAYVYVDGFNLYYGAVKGTPYRWLNPVALVRQMLPMKYNIDLVRYFTARVSGAEDPGAPLRQQVYFDALATLPEVRLHFGRFLAKTMWRPITNFPVAGATIRCPGNAVSFPTGVHAVSGGSLTKNHQLSVGIYPPKGTPRSKATAPIPDSLVTQVHSMEEKGSDVNLAAHLLNDAWKGAFDEAVVVSNDTDLVEPIRMVATERNLPVLVICPGRYQMANDLRQVATFKAHIRPAMLSSSQFPDPIPSTAIRKPATW